MMKMTEKRRRLIFQVTEKNFDLLPLMYHLNAELYCDEILTYLISKNLTGGALMEWTTKKFANNVGQIVTFLKIKIGRITTKTI